MSKTFEEIVKEVWTSLTIDDVRWSVDGKPRFVTEDNVKEVIQQGLEALYGGPPASSFMIGGILIYKWDEDHYDIYVRKGETDGKSS